MRTVFNQAVAEGNVSKATRAVSNVDGFKLYGLAGEIESSDVEARSDFNMLKRRQVPPYSSNSRFR